MMEALVGLFFLPLVASECLSNATLNEQAAGGIPIPKPGSCCMNDVCGLACPLELSPVAHGFGVAVIVFVVISVILGMSTYFLVHGDAVNFFVAGRSLGVGLVSISLAAQAIDTNALLGNADLSYQFGFYDGIVIPIGLALSLFLNSIFLAHFIQKDKVLTLPDVFAKRYGLVVEVLVSIATIISFIMLLAGNLLGFGVVVSYLWNIPQTAAIWVAAVVVCVYTESGGMFSAVYTSVFQAAIGFLGVLVGSYWFIANESTDASPPSIGFPNYIYPDNIGDGGVCDMYNGTACQFNPGSCCYNKALWCPGYPTFPCERYDRGAYATGDTAVYPDQMTNPNALDPFPNAILWNWATIFILGFGNLAALDFQARCMASRTPRIARLGNAIAGCITLFVGVPATYLGVYARIYFGPDSVYSGYDADSCLSQLGLPTCGLWIPVQNAVVKLLAHQAPAFVGGWTLIGLIAASLSTAGGAVLAMGTVFSNNIARQFDYWYPSLITSENLLFMSRLSTVPFTIAGAAIAAYYQSPHQDGTSYLLIVAFDVVLATVVAPLFGCYYAALPSPRAALVSILGGAMTRIVLELTLPKDGYLLLPYSYESFLSPGLAASTNPPYFIDSNITEWNPIEQPCEQTRYADYTGLDSLSSFFVSVVLFVGIQWLENRRGPLFHFRGSEGYDKPADEAFSKPDGSAANSSMDSSSNSSSSSSSSSEDEGDDDVESSSDEEEVQQERKSSGDDDEVRPLRRGSGDDAQQQRGVSDASPAAPVPSPTPPPPPIPPESPTYALPSPIRAAYAREA